MIPITEQSYNKIARQFAINNVLPKSVEGSSDSRAGSSVENSASEKIIYHLIIIFIDKVRCLY